MDTTGFYTPLLEALNKHKNKVPISYHVPGHKNGTLMAGSFNANHFFHEISKIDQTEISGLDDLHAPNGPIEEAQHLLAALYRTKNSYFLVNGSTVGNISMIMAAFNEGDQVLVQRNSHKSIMNGLELANIRPVFITPDIDRQRGVSGEVTFSSVKEALKKYPQIKGIILTYPNYYGVTFHLKKIIEFAHQNGIPVLVDEAHGAHFIIGEPFPLSAVKLGADIVIQSAHKTLPALTMGSYLHYNSSFVSKGKLEGYLHMLQSSSPSYPIMASLDYARAYVQGYTSQDKQYVIKELNDFKDKLSNIESLTVLEDERGTDPLKITIQSKEGYTGYELQELMERQGVYAEMADMKNVLFVFPLLKDQMKYPVEETISRLKTALANKSKTIEAISAAKDIYIKYEQVTAFDYSYKEVNKADDELVHIHLSKGRICKENIIPYPPGIPILLKGELISQDHIDTLNQLINAGVKFHGGKHLKQNRILTAKV